jgi:hypothetical protein
MAEEARLQPLIQQAYGTGVQGLDTSGIQDVFTKDVAKKETEYKSALDIGSDLGAQYYTKIGDGLDSIIDEATSGNLTVGSPAWLNKVGKLRNAAIQTKQIQDTSEEMGNILRDKPDTNIFYYTNENGEQVAGGYDDYLTQVDSLLSQDYENVGELQNKHSTLLQGFKPMRQGFTEGYDSLRNGAQELSVLLHKGGGTERSVPVTSRAGNLYTVRTTSTLSPEQVEGAIATFVDQHEEFLTDDYFVKKRNGQTDATSPKEYVQGAIDRMLIKTAASEQKGTIPTPKDDKSKSLSIRRSGSGWENDDFMFERISETEVAVNSKGNTEPNKVWRGIDELGGEDGAQGEKKSLTSVVFKDGKFYAKLVGENLLEPVLVDFDKNGKLLADFYGVTKESAKEILGMSDSGDATPNNETIMGLGNPFPAKRGKFDPPQ